MPVLIQYYVYVSNSVEIQALLTALTTSFDEIFRIMDNKGFMPKFGYYKEEFYEKILLKTH